MFKTQNFCHIASNNRNQVKAGVFVYRTTDDLATVSASGYFNERIIDINLHDLIIHEKIDASDATKVQRNVLCVTERTLENVGVVVIKSKWEEDIEGDIEDLDGKIAALKTYVEQHFVNIDGSSIMTGPLKFRAGSFEGAIAGGLGDGISVYKMNSDGSINSEVAALTKTNGFIPGTTNTLNIGSSSLKWKDAYIGRVISGVLNNGADINVPTTAGTLALTSDIAIKSTDANIVNPTAGQWLQYNGTKWENISLTPANTDLSNLSSTGANIGNWSSNVSNCITEIPQDINLELSSGTLNLASGSKIYVPNGSSFNEISIADNLTLNNTNNGNYLLYVNSTGTQLYSRDISAIVSGTSDSLAGTRYHTWYDTTNNLVKHYDNTTNPSHYTIMSLPVAIITVSGGVISSIDQVFNGFGFIGSTIFALPGVKGLIPNGRNADGSLKNSTFTVSTLLTRTFSGAQTGRIVSLSANSISAASGFSYDETKNINIYNNAQSFSCLIGKADTSTNGIISFVTYQNVFHAVDYSDSDYIANCAMPSSKYIDVTLGTSGTTYTMPADGYLVLQKVANATGQFISMFNSTNQLSTGQISYSSSDALIRLYMPVSKGDVIQINYSLAGTTGYFRFIYANGSK